MTPGIPTRRHAKTPPPGETGQEALYLRSLSERQVPVAVKLRGGEVVRGWIEYFDDGMLRLTREGKPNLFIYKHQIETITETGRRRGPRNGAGIRPQGLPSEGESAAETTETKMTWTPKAAEIAREAGARLREFFAEGVATEYKGDVDLVTVADRTVEKLIRTRLGEAFPEHGIYGEEGTRERMERRVPLVRRSTGWDDEFCAWVSAILRVDGAGAARRGAEAG